jgi:5-methylcytosine-specific restriction protein A
MALAPTPCAQTGCLVLASYRGKCEKHQPPPWKGSGRAARLPTDWATRRRIVLSTHKAICHLCNQAGADGVDHVIAGDDHSLDNLRPVHDKVPPYCHKYKSSAEGHEAKLKPNKGTPPNPYWKPPK